jgi:hypothetical protein
MARQTRARILFFLISPAGLAGALVAACLLAAMRPAMAFVPSSHTIFARVARGGGKGTYAIEQEVQFRTEADAIMLRERWIVQSGDLMRLSVSGLKGSQENWRLENFYRDGKRQTLDGRDGSLSRAIATSPDFIEPVLHFRSLPALVGWLKRVKLIPGNLGEPRHFVHKTNPYTPEPGVRLARAGGVIAWAFGEPSPADGTPMPGLWIDQDEFQLRRMRFPSRAEVQADRHASFAGGLRLPRERTVAWDGNVATIRVLTVKSLPDNAATQALLLPAAPGQVSGSAFGADLRASGPRLPEATQVREFYSRFR